MAGPDDIDPSVPPSGTGCVECLATRRMVVPPPAMRPVRPCRML